MSPANCQHLAPGDGRAHVARTSSVRVCALALSVACSLVTACQSSPKAGQSGSENLPGSGGGSGGITSPCPCELKRWRSAALHVTVLAQEHGSMRLRVEEVLHGALPLVPGDVIEADRYDDALPCFQGCASVKTGAQAFAFYAPAEPALPSCAEREACIATCEAEHTGTVREDVVGLGNCACRADPPSDFVSITGSRLCGVPYPALDSEVCDGPCTRDSLERCPPRPEQNVKRGHVRLSPWGDRIVFSRNARGEIGVPRSELDVLWDDEGPDERENLQRCRERVGDWTDLAENLEGV